MTDGLLIGVRFAVYLTLAPVFGLAAFCLYSLRPHERGAALSLRPWLVASAAVGVLLSAAWIALVAAAMAGAPAWPIDRAAVGALVTGSAIGTAWTFRVVALALAALVAAFGSGRSIGLAIVALCAAVALGSLAWIGHGAADEGSIGWVHLVADILHLLAAGAWVGSLVGLILLVSRSVRRVDTAHVELTHRALHGFGTIGAVVVSTIVVTGLVNAWVLVGIGHVASLGATLYGRLLLAKLAVFAAMLGLATLNRFRLTPRFRWSIANGDHCAALMSLRASLAVETTSVIAILALVAWLGTLAPPAA